MATQLRKKAPFHCRTQVGGKFTCLAVLTDDDGDFCPPCAAKGSGLKLKMFAPIPRPDFGGDKHPESCPAHWGPNPCNEGGR